MNKRDLFLSAARLTPPSRPAIVAYKKHQEHMTREVTRRLLSRPDLDSLVGAGNRPMMEDSVRNHARFMESLFAAYDHRMFVETILWVYRAFRAHGFKMAYWAAQLSEWQTVLRETLQSEDVDEILPFYEWMMENQPAFGVLTEPVMVSVVPSIYAGS